MGTIFFLILFPLLVALVLLIVKADKARDTVVIAASVIIAAVSIYCAATYMGDGTTYFDFSSEIVNYIMMIIECGVAIVITILAFKYKKYLAAVFALIQTPLMVWFELTTGHSIEVEHNAYVDELSLIMILIIGIIGTLICVYAMGYMKDFQHHQPAGSKDRRPWFFFLLFLFLAAMFGLVTSNNLIWMYFFWEITSLCSFFLIGFTKTKEAIRNSFRALIMNLLGGLGFCLAIIILGYGWDESIRTLQLSDVILYGESGYGVIPALMIPVGLLAFAGITKAAQMPFNSWLLGAMVAPTPTSALLHSSTMVKAGVFLILKLAPCLGWGNAEYGMVNYAGIMVMAVGGITFLLASFAAISQSNAKRVLAYSTIANLGLIVVCGGIGTAAAVWAGIMLIIFHAVTKSLLFLCVGTAEHNIGSRNIEDMDGLFDRMPRLAACMMIGISAMFLAPLGMLVSKWAALDAFIETGNVFMSVFLVAVLCFGSATTVFYWVKWLGKLSAVVAGTENIEGAVHKSEKFVHTLLVILVLVTCLGFPVISSAVVVPYLGADMAALSSGNMMIMCIMLAVIILITILFFGNTKKKIVPIYLAGVNQGDNLTFRNSFQGSTAVSLKNWYMDKYFGENKMNWIGCIAAAATIAVVLVIFAGYVIGGAI